MLFVAPVARLVAVNSALPPAFAVTLTVPVAQDAESGVVVALKAARVVLIVPNARMAAVMTPAIRAGVIKGLRTARPDVT